MNPSAPSGWGRGRALREVRPQPAGCGSRHGGVGSSACAQEAGGARSLRPSSPLCGPRSLRGPAPQTGPGQLLCNRLFCSAVPSEQRTAGRGLTEPIGGAAWGCPPPLLSLSPLLALRNLSLRNAFPSQAGQGASWHKQRRCRPHHWGAIKGFFLWFLGGRDSPGSFWVSLVPAPLRWGRGWGHL